MSEINTDIKINQLNINSNTSNSSPLPTNSDSSLTISSDTIIREIDNGKTIFTGQNIGNTYTITLPTTTVLPLGSRFIFVQQIPIETDDGIIIKTFGNNDSLSTGSYGLNSSGLVRTSNGICNSLRIIGNDDNCQHGLGSIVDCQVVSLNRWLISIKSMIEGTGSDAYSFDKI